LEVITALHYTNRDGGIQACALCACGSLK